MPGNNKQIEAMLDASAQRDTIAFGMYQRYLLNPAGMTNWTDPREADGVPILTRMPIRPGAINERLHVPFDREIVSNKVAYFASNIQLVFDPALPGGVEEFYKWMDESNGMKSKALTLAKYAVDQGTSFIMAWVNPDGDFKIRPLRADSAYVEYDPLSGHPKYGYRYFIGDDKTSFCEVYDGIDVTTFGKVSGTWIAKETRPHGLGTVEHPAIPIIELANNPERIGNPEMVISLCDAFDLSMSDLSSEIAQLRLSYLIMKGTGTDSDTIKADLAKGSIALIDDPNGDAYFVDRNMNVGAIQQLQNQLRTLIYEGASSYDPTVLSQGNPPTAYEVNMRLEALEQDSQVTQSEWETGLRHYDYVVKNYLTTFQAVPDYSVNDIDRIFRRTAPRNILQALVEARSAGITLSNQTLVELSGLPVDPVIEAERIAAQAPVKEEKTSVVDGVNNNEAEPDTGPSQE